MSAPQGRFQSPDSPLVGQDPSNPQSWNLFAYVLNNPLSYTDPTGHYCPIAGCNPPPTQPTGGGGFPIDCFFYSFLCGGGIGPGNSPAPQPPPPPRPPLPANPLAPSNGTQVSQARQAKLLTMLNVEHGTNLTDANVTGTYNNGTAANLLISATGLTPAQFNSFQPGRYTTYGGQFLLGFGMAGHIADEPGVNPGAVFSNSNVAGVLSVSFAFHDDHGYANNPIGALLHFFADVLGHNSRKPC